MTPVLRPPDGDEPAVTNPELRRLVDEIRGAPTPVLRVTPEAIFAGVEARKQGRRRVAVALSLAAAAALALVWLRPLDMSSRPGVPAPVAQRAPEPPPPPAPEHPAPPALAAAVRIVAEEGPQPAILGSWEVSLPPGRYELHVDEHTGPEVLRAVTASGTVEIVHGRVEIVVAAASTSVALRSGVATWIAPDGARRELGLEDHVPGDMAQLPAVPGPSELARRADEQLAAGKRDAAIVTLRQLVTAHPQSAAARGGLLDLARLLKAESRPDEARCAYNLYLARYPGKEQLADEVRKALARLGEGPECRGLRPR